MADEEHDTGTSDGHVGFGATNVPVPTRSTFDGLGAEAPAAEARTPAPDADEWVVVLETQDEQELARIGQDLEEGGVSVELEVESDVSLMRGMERTYGVFVPAAEAERARALIEEGQEYRNTLEVLDAAELDEQPGDELFLLRDRIDAEMPGASKRQREKEYRRRRKELEAKYGSRRQTPISVLVLLVVGVSVVVFLVTAVAS